MKKRYYLAYGSNLNIEQMKYRCPKAKPVGSMTLNNYRLVYKGSEDNYSYLTLEKCEGCNIPLGIFEISLFDISLLDRYEGYPELYSKKYIPITIENKKTKALIYIMNEQFDYHIPSDEYIKTCEQGYSDFGFEKDILDVAITYTKEKIQDVKKLKKF